MLKLIRTFWSYSIGRLPCHTGCFRNNLAHDSDCRFVLLCFHLTFTFICFTFSTSYQNKLDRFNFHLILALILTVFSFKLLNPWIDKWGLNSPLRFWRCVTWGRDWAKKARDSGVQHSAQSFRNHTIRLTVRIVCLLLFSFYVGALPSFQEINAMFLFNLRERVNIGHLAFGKNLWFWSSE